VPRCPCMHRSASPVSPRSLCSLLGAHSVREAVVSSSDLAPDWRLTGSPPTVDQGSLRRDYISLVFLCMRTAKAYFHLKDCSLVAALHPRDAFWRAWFQSHPLIVFSLSNSGVRSRRLLAVADLPVFDGFGSDFVFTMHTCAHT